MKRSIGFGIVVLIIAMMAFGPASAQDNSQATISALQTQVAELQSTVDARGQKINVQRTQIAELKSQIQPTPTATAVLTGKDAFAPLGDPREIMVRTGNHIGEKYSFCGSVLTIFVAGPGDKYYLGDSKPKGYGAQVQIFPDGSTDPVIAGFDGDTSGIYENSYVCVWATLVDTTSFTNSFGGQISNPLFDAEYLELAG